MKKLYLWGIWTLFVSASISQENEARSPLLYQEKADVVFRNLAEVLGIGINLHGAIYEKYNGENPDDPQNHTVYQMTGVVSSSWCFPKIQCVDKSLGIEQIPLSVFKSIATYHGAFKHKRSPSLKDRWKILEMAEHLSTFPIEYIVVKTDSMFKLLFSYFEYKDKNGDGKIIPEEITKMRSDAFVEYCYAAAGYPIMDADITTSTGAAILVSLAANTNLYPSVQNARMEDSDIKNPEVYVYESAGEKESNSGEYLSYNILARDMLSGPGILEIWDANPTPEGKPYASWISDSTQTAHVYTPGDFPALGKLDAKIKWKFRVIDQSGNYTVASPVPVVKSVSFFLAEGKQQVINGLAAHKIMQAHRNSSESASASSEDDKDWMGVSRCPSLLQRKVWMDLILDGRDSIFTT